MRCTSKMTKKRKERKERERERERGGGVEREAGGGRFRKEQPVQWNLYNISCLTQMTVLRTH